MKWLLTCIASINLFKLMVTKCETVGMATDRYTDAAQSDNNTTVDSMSAVLKRESCAGYAYAYINPITTSKK